MYSFFRLNTCCCEWILLQIKLNCMMDWTLCVICQVETSEALSCPLKRNNHDAVMVYRDFLQNVKAFEELCALPAPINFGKDMTPERFHQQGASWHRSCHQKFNKSKLDRERNKKRKQTDSRIDEQEDFRRSKRQSLSFKTTCLFCDANAS